MNIAGKTMANDKLYLIYGNDETEVGNARYNLIQKLMTPEERDSGLTEIRGPGNQPLTLQRSFNEIVQELGTSSFLEDSQRVVVIYDLKDLTDGKSPRGGKKTTTKKTKNINHADRLLDWLKDVFSTTGNTAIFVVNENDEKRKRLAEASPLAKYLLSEATCFQCREKPIQFEFDNHLLNGNGPAAIALLREWIDKAGNDSSGRLRVYNTIAGFIELVYQAYCLQQAKEKKVPATQVEVQDYPSLSKVPSWKAKKIHAIASRFSAEEMHQFIRDIHQVQRYMYPSGNEDYVPNWEEVIELLVFKLAFR